ncbi:MAG: HIT family protein [Nocardioides sp.]|uniref:HIT family protein n=1 Tax=Nocardioides sp. TaxID=35761 RepID=UPI0039E45B87
MSTASPDCVFCAIVAGTTPAHLVLDEPAVVGFLDRRPVFKGHVLVAPRDHVVTLPDLTPDQLTTVMTAAQRVAAAVPGALDAQGTFVAVNNVVSQSVPHLHVHVVPRRRGDGLRGFFWPRTTYDSDQEAAEIAGVLRTAVAASLVDE